MIVPLFVLSVLQHHLKPLVGEQWGEKGWPCLSELNQTPLWDSSDYFFCPFAVARPEVTKGKLYNDKHWATAKTQMSPMVNTIKSVEKSP